MSNVVTHMHDFPDICIPVPHGNYKKKHCCNCPCSVSTVSLGFVDLIDCSEADRCVSSAYIMLCNMLLAFGRSIIYIMKT